MFRSKAYTYLLLLLMPAITLAGYAPLRPGEPQKEFTVSLPGWVQADPPRNEADFSAIHDGQKVLLSWKTGAEKRFDYFTIEKAKDGVHFSAALMVKAGGVAAGAYDYRDVDYAPLQGASYYRLKATDYEGNITYSPVLPVNVEFTRNNGLQPASGKLPDAEELKRAATKDVLVVVRDARGNEFTAKVKVTREQDEKLYAQDSMNSLNKGSYIVLASSYNALYSQRLIVR